MAQSLLSCAFFIKPLNAANVSRKKKTPQNLGGVWIISIYNQQKLFAFYRFRARIVGAVFCLATFCALRGAFVASAEFSLTEIALWASACICRAYFNYFYHANGSVVAGRLLYCDGSACVLRRALLCVILCKQTTGGKHSRKCNQFFHSLIPSFLFLFYRYIAIILQN